MAAMAATAIKAAIKPYSIAVAPSSFLKNFVLERRIKNVNHGMIRIPFD